MKIRTLTYSCPKCQHEVSFKYYPGDRGTYWDPPSGPDIECEHEACPQCGEVITDEQLEERGDNSIQEDMERQADDEHDRAAEERMFPEAEDVP